MFQKHEGGMQRVKKTPYLGQEILWHNMEDITSF